MRNEPYELSATDLMDLRLRMRNCGFVSDGTSGVLTAAPWVTYLLASREYCLHNQGFTIAITANEELACYLLRNERIETGYCRRILDPALNVEAALLAPEARAEYAQRRAVEAATQRLDREAADEAARRRRTQLRAPDPLTLSIEDLLS